MVPVLVKGSEQLLQALLNAVHLQSTNGAQLVVRGERWRVTRRFPLRERAVSRTKLTFGGVSLRAAV